MDLQLERLWQTNTGSFLGWNQSYWWPPQYVWKKQSKIDLGGRPCIFWMLMFYCFAFLFWISTAHHSQNKPYIHFSTHWELAYSCKRHLWIWLSFSRGKTYFVYKVPGVFPQTKSQNMSMFRFGCSSPTSRVVNERPTNLPSIDKDQLHVALTQCCEVQPHRVWLVGGWLGGIREG